MSFASYNESLSFPRSNLLMRALLACIVNLVLMLKVLKWVLKNWLDFLDQ